MGKTFKDRRPKLPRSMKEAQKAGKVAVKKKKMPKKFHWREEILEGDDDGSESPLSEE